MRTAIKNSVDTLRGRGNNEISATSLRGSAEGEIRINFTGLCGRGEGAVN